MNYNREDLKEIALYDPSPSNSNTIGIKGKWKKTSPTLDEVLRMDRFLYLFNNFLFFRIMKNIYMHNLHTIIHKFKIIN